MKLTEIQIDRCGVWRNLTLPVQPHGVNVDAQGGACDVVVTTSHGAHTGRA